MGRFDFTNLRNTIAQNEVPQEQVHNVAPVNPLLNDYVAPSPNVDRSSEYYKAGQLARKNALIDSYETQRRESARPHSSDPYEEHYLTAKDNLDFAKQNLNYATDPMQESQMRKELQMAQLAYDAAKKELAQSKLKEANLITEEQAAGLESITPQNGRHYEGVGNKAQNPDKLGTKDQLPDISNLNQLALQQGVQPLTETVPGRANQAGYRTTNTITGAVKGFGADMANAAGTVVRGMGESSASANPAALKAQGLSDAEIKAELEKASSQNKGQRMVDAGTSVQDASDRLAQSSAEDINQAKLGLNGAGRLAVDIGSNAIQMGGDALAAVLTGGVVNPLTSMFARSAGGAAREARNDGADTAKQLAYGAVRGGIEVLTEKMFDGLAGLYGKGGADDIVESVIGKLAGSSDAGKTALRTLFSGIGEAVEEGVSGVTEPLTQAIYKGIRSIPEGYNKEQASEVLYSMLVGFAMGGAGGAVNILNGGNAEANAKLNEAAQNTEQTTNPRAGMPSEAWEQQNVNQNPLVPRNGRNYEGTGKKAQNPEKAAAQAAETAAPAAPVAEETAQTIDYAQQKADAEAKLAQAQAAYEASSSDPEMQPVLLHQVEQAQQELDEINAKIQADASKTPSEHSTTSHTSESTNTQENSQENAEAPSGELNSDEDTNGTENNQSGIPPQNPTGIKSDSTYEELGEKYGTIEQGEKPVRDSETPQRTSPGSKVSQTVRTVQEAGATPESRLPDIQSAVVDGKFSFVPIQNSERSANAEAKLKNDGWQKTLRDWTAAVRSGHAGADLVAQGAVLLNHAANNSECTATEYIDLLQDYVQLTRSTAQGLQAARILKTLSPEGKLYGIQKTVQNMNEAEQVKRSNNSSETNEARYSIPDELVEEYRQQTTDEGRDAVIEKMQQAIADQIPSTLGDVFTAVRYLNMLGNFKTQVRNFAGNAGMMLVQKAKNTVRSAMETIASAATGGRYQKQYSSVYNPALLGTAWRDLKQTAGLKETAMGEKKYSSSSSQLEKGIEDKRNPFKFGDNKLTRTLHIANKQGPVGKVLELYNRVTSWAMEAGDDIFVSMNYADALAGYMQAHDISSEQWTSLVAEADSNPSSDAAKTVDAARAFAIQQAQEATFRDTNRISEFAQNFDKNWKGAKVITQGIAPFRKTPANVGVRMEEYSPLGFVNTIVKAIQAAKGNENVTGTDVIDSLSKAVTGSGLAMIGFALAQAGRARTKSDDDKQEAFDKLRGLQDYSITIGDGLNITLDWAVPASASLFMGVELYNLITDGTISPDDAMKIIGNLTAPMLEMSMLSGLNDALNNISSFNEDTDALPQFLLNSFVGYISQGLTNTLAGQFEQANEEYRQSYYTNPDNKLIPTSLQKKLAQAGNKTPGVDFQASDYIDAWGRKQKNADSKLESYINALLNPSYTSDLDKKTTKVDSELQRLYDYGKDKEDFPNVIPQQTKRNTTVNGKRLTPEEYDQYATKKGQESLRLVTSLMGSKEYQNLSDEGKAKAISECYSYAKYLADEDISKSRKEESTNDSYYNLMTGVDKSGTQYDKTKLNESNFVAYTAFKIGLDEAVKNGDYQTIDKYVTEYGKENKNLQTVLGERNSTIRALSAWKDAGLDSKTYYTVQKELVKSQQKLDKSQKTGSAVELDALANVNIPEATKKRLIDSLPDYGSKTVKGVYDILYDYGFNSKQINDFWNQSQDWVYKDSGEAQSSQKAGTLQPLEAAYAIQQLPGLDDTQRTDIYNKLKEVANVPYKINDWGNYTYGSEVNYLASGRAYQNFGASQTPTQSAPSGERQHGQHPNYILEALGLTG